MKTPLKIIAPAIAILAVAIAAPASAEIRSEYVSYADLNLADEGGQARLDARIKRAVANVCGSAHATTTLHERLDQQRCAKKAISDASRQAREKIAAYQNGERFAAKLSPIVAGN